MSRRSLRSHKSNGVGDYEAVNRADSDGLMDDTGNSENYYVDDINGTPKDTCCCMFYGFKRVLAAFLHIILALNRVVTFLSTLSFFAVIFAVFLNAGLGIVFGFPPHLNALTVGLTLLMIQMWLLMWMCLHVFWDAMITSWALQARFVTGWVRGILVVLMVIISLAVSASGKATLLDAFFVSTLVVGMVISLSYAGGLVYYTIMMARSGYWKVDFLRIYSTRKTGWIILGSLFVFCLLTIGVAVPGFSKGGEPQLISYAVFIPIMSTFLCTILASRVSVQQSKWTSLLIQAMYQYRTSLSNLEASEAKSCGNSRILKVYTLRRRAVAALDRTKYSEYRNSFIAFGIGYLLLFGMLLLMAIVYFAVSGSLNQVDPQTSSIERLDPYALGNSVDPNLFGNSSLHHPNRTTLLPGAYPVCGSSWKNLHILDFAFLSLVAYKLDINVVRADLASYFQNTEFDFDLLYLSQTQRGSYFFHIRDSASNISVIGIRGTSSIRDALEDLDLWSEITVLQGISFFVPLIHIWPTVTTSVVVQIANALEPKIKNLYYNPIIDYIDNHVNATDNIVLTGHSLGGGVANIVGALRNLPSYAFEPPGQVFGHMKFGYSLPDTQGATSVVSTSDPVPSIDKQAGLVQTIECKQTSLFSCHSLSRAYCEMARRCYGVPCIEI